MSFVKKSDVKNHLFPAHHKGNHQPGTANRADGTASSPLESGAASPLTISAGKDNLMEFPSKKENISGPTKEPDSSIAADPEDSGIAKP